MHRRAVALAAAALLASAWTEPAAAQASDIELTAPGNGWRNSAGDAARYLQPVHYPAVMVSTPDGQAAGATIAGRIGRASKSTTSAPAVSEPNARDSSQPESRQDGSGQTESGQSGSDAGEADAAASTPARANVATLVVNGIAMPQRIEDDGRFSRPYAFAAGSNSVELRSADGRRKREQFYDAYAGKTPSRLRVVLSWDSDGTDLDLHVVSPDGQHAWYGERVVANGGALDVDVTTGYGPEIYSSAAPPAGTYLVYVNYYGSGSGEQALTIAQIAVVTDENTPDERQQVFRVPMRKAGELTLVKSFSMR